MVVNGPVSGITGPFLMITTLLSTNINETGPVEDLFQVYGHRDLRTTTLNVKTGKSK